MVWKYNKFIFNLLGSFCFFVILVVFLEGISYLCIYFLPYPFKAEGVNLNKLAWESSYLERKEQIPSQGPREGYWGARFELKEPKSNPYTDTIAPPIHIDKLMVVDNKGFQVIGDPKTSKWKILILGGSVGFAAYASDIQHTYFAQLHDFLIARGHSVVIYILACGSWTSDHEFAALSNYGLKIKPDIVIFVNGLNDLIMKGYGDKELSSRVELSIRKHFISLLNDISRVWKYIKKFSNTARLIRVIKSRYAVSANNFAEKTGGAQKHKSLIVENYLNNIKKSIILARFHNFKLVFVLQPALFYKLNATLLERRILFYSTEGNNFISKLQSEYATMRNVLAALEDSQKTYFCDCSNALSGEEETTFADFWHFSDFGHTLLANCFKRKILQIINDSNR